MQRQHAVAALHAASQLDWYREWRRVNRRRDDGCYEGLLDPTQPAPNETDAGLRPYFGEDLVVN